MKNLIHLLCLGISPSQDFRLLRTDTEGKRKFHSRSSSVKAKYLGALVAAGYLTVTVVMA